MLPSYQVNYYGIAYFDLNSSTIVCFENHKSFLYLYFWRELDMSVLKTVPLKKSNYWYFVGWKTDSHWKSL